MMANTGNREVEPFLLSWEGPSEGTVLPVLEGMYPRGLIAYSVLMTNLVFSFVSFGDNRFVSELSIITQTSMAETS